jgi:hypothetical protein
LLAFFGLPLSALLYASVASGQVPDSLRAPWQFDPFAEPGADSSGDLRSSAPNADGGPQPDPSRPPPDSARMAAAGNPDSRPSENGRNWLPETSGWTWQALPENIIYPSYLAGVKEPRLASACNYDKNFGWTWDSTLGARVGLLRYGTERAERPDGCELDVEGAAFPRLDLEHDRDLASVDFRFGVPVTLGFDRYQEKLAYYHSCSHLGDQYMLLFPELVRTNYTRDAVVWGHSYYPTDDLRIYGEASWGFHVWGAARPWEFQFGIEYSPVESAGRLGGSPFAAVNADLRQDVDYSGNLVVQAGWQWRSPSHHRFRAGMQYFVGKSEQFQFLNRDEETVGFAIWYDN